MSPFMDGRRTTGQAPSKNSRVSSIWIAACELELHSRHPSNRGAHRASAEFLEASYSRHTFYR
jgi:hypothetical protein